MPSSSYETYGDILEALNSCSLDVSNKVFLFKDVSFDSPKHYYVAIPIRKNEYMLLVMFSSQIEKVTKRYQLLGEGEESLLFFERDDFEFLTKEKSVIDCNSPTYYTCEKLASQIDGKLTIIEAEINEIHISNIKSAIKKSPMVKDAIKNKFS